MTKKGSSSLQRRGGTRKPKRIIRVFAEGKQTEPAYLRAARRYVAEGTAISTELVCTGGPGAPSTIVDRAVRDRKEGLEADEWWCLFDVEAPSAHGDLNAAIDKAERSGVAIGVSNPCFEVWLIAHYRDLPGYQTSSAAKALLSRTAPRYESELASLALFGDTATAIRRCERLDEKHRLDGTRFPHDNPSSTVAEFAKSIFRDMEN